MGYSKEKGYLGGADPGDVESGKKKKSGRGKKGKGLQKRPPRLLPTVAKGTGPSESHRRTGPNKLFRLVRLRAGINYHSYTKFARPKEDERPFLEG